MNFGVPELLIILVIVVLVVRRQPDLGRGKRAGRQHQGIQEGGARRGDR